MILRWSRQARQDLLKIGRYINSDDPRAARRQLQRLRGRARQALQFPHSGRMVPEYGRDDLREFIVGHYRLVYQVEERQIVRGDRFRGSPPDAGPGPALTGRAGFRGLGQWPRVMLAPGTRCRQTRIGCPAEPGPATHRRATP